MKIRRIAFIISTILITILEFLMLIATPYHTMIQQFDSEGVLVIRLFGCMILLLICLNGYFLTKHTTWIMKFLYGFFFLLCILRLLTTWFFLGWM